MNSIILCIAHCCSSVFVSHHCFWYNCICYLFVIYFCIPQYNCWMKHTSALPCDVFIWCCNFILYEVGNPGIWDWVTVTAVSVICLLGNHKTANSSVFLSISIWITSRGHRMQHSAHSVVRIKVKLRDINLLLLYLLTYHIFKNIENF